jgi:LysM repeat protein
MASLPEQPRLPSADPSPSAKPLIVKKGETLAAVARRGGISIAELRKLNQLKSDRVTLGTRLVTAPTSKSEPLSVKATPAATNPLAKSTKGPRVTRYTVKRGDTLQSIARQFKVDQKDLIRWNGNATSHLRPGQQLMIQITQNS